MTQKQSAKSTSLSGLNRQYRLLKRQFTQQATNKDLIHLLTLLGTPQIDLAPQIQRLVKVLAVSAITEELMDRKRKGNYVPGKDSPTIVVRNAPADAADGRPPVHREGSDVVPRDDAD